MKKLVLVIVVLISAFTCLAQVNIAGTYKYTKKIFGDQRCSEVTQYLVFKSTKDVTWCVQSSDGYLTPIAFGSYNSSTRRIIFSRTNKLNFLFSYLNDDPYMNISFSGGRMIVKPHIEGYEYILDENQIIFSKCDYMINASNKLVGTSWASKGDQYGNKDTLYFISSKEVLLNGKPVGYILIGKAIGICAGKISKRMLVGSFNEGIINLHESGINNNLNYPSTEFEQLR